MTGAKITLDANGFYRCSVAYTGAAAVTFSFGLSDADASRAVTTGKTAVFYGTMAEGSAAFASSYIPTTTGSVTRAADVLSIPSTSGVDTTAAIKWIDVGAVLPGKTLMRSPSGGFAMDMSAGNVARAFISGAGVASQAFVPGAGTTHRFAANYGKTSGAVRATVDGGTIFTASGAAMAASTVVQIGADGASSGQPFGHIQQIAIFNGILASDAAMQGLFA